MINQLNTPPRPGDHLITDWQASGLPKPSQLRMKLATISRRIVIRKLGRLPRRNKAMFKP